MLIASQWVDIYRFKYYNEGNLGSAIDETLETKVNFRI